MNDAEDADIDRGVTVGSAPTWLSVPYTVRPRFFRGPRRRASPHPLEWYLAADVLGESVVVAEDGIDNV